MKQGDRVMVVANRAIRENKVGMGTLEKYIGTDRKMYGGYHVETWELWFDDTPWREGTYRCRLLVDESQATESINLPWEKKGGG